MTFRTVCRAFAGVATVAAVLPAAAVIGHSSTDSTAIEYGLVGPDATAIEYGLHTATLSGDAYVESLGATGFDVELYVEGIQGTGARHLVAAPSGISGGGRR